MVTVFRVACGSASLVAAGSPFLAPCSMISVGKIRLVAAGSVAFDQVRRERQTEAAVDGALDGGRRSAR